MVRDKCQTYKGCYVKGKKFICSGTAFSVKICGKIVYVVRTLKKDRNICSNI